MKKGKKEGGNNLVHLLLYSSESISGLLFSLVSISLIARHFGPENLARFSIAQSVSTIFIVLATLGLDQYILRELSRNKNDAEFTTSIFIGMVLGWAAYVLLVGAYYYFFSEFSRDIFLLVSIVITTLLLKVIFIKNYLQSQNKPKPIAISSFLSRVIAIAYLLTGTYFDFGFNAMMMYMPLQALALTVGMAIAEPAFLQLFEWRQFNAKRLIGILQESSPLLVSTVLYLVYSQSDILIMSKLLSPAEVGVYSAAIRLIPQAAFIGYVLVATFYRELDKKLLTNREEFEAYAKSLLTIQFGIGIAMAIFVCLTSDIIIDLLYGAQYADGGKILAIASWAWVFILPAALYSRILIMLGMVRYELIKMVIIAPVIVLTNYFAIKYTGIIGSAVVFVIAYLLVDFAVYFLFKETRYLGLIGFQAVRDLLTKPKQTITMATALLKAKSNV